MYVWTQFNRWVHLGLLSWIGIFFEWLVSMSPHGLNMSSYCTLKINIDADLELSQYISLKSGFAEFIKKSHERYFATRNKYTKYQTYCTENFDSCSWINFVFTWDSWTKIIKKFLIKFTRILHTRIKVNFQLNSKTKMYKQNPSLIRPHWVSIPGPSD